jgi:predicted alpha/beta hydrolase family esterase
MNSGKRNIFTINLGSAFQDMDSCAEKVHLMVEEIKARTGRSDLKIIGHSMGGLVAVHYRQRYADDVDVKDIITLGAPLNGTRVAVIAKGSPLAAQMRYCSDFVRDKQSFMETDLHTRYLHLVSDCDWFIWPSNSAGAGRAPKAKVVHLKETGHVPFLFSIRTSQEIITHLDEHD